MIDRAAPVAAPVNDIAPVVGSSFGLVAPARVPVPSAPLGAPRRVADLVLQAKLSVGPVDDPAEREADAVAARVVRALRRPAVEPTADEAPAPARPVAQGAVPIARIIQRAAPIGAAGGEIDRDTERIVRMSRGGGAPLPPTARGPMERAFGADFSGVRVHEGARSADLNDRIQAKAFTTGSDIFFRDGFPDTSTVSGQSLLAHELTHTIQQGSAVARMAAITSHRGDGIVQRHASWEHKMLGDVDPSTLEIIAAGRDVAAEKAKSESFWASTRATAKTIRTESGRKIDIESVLHTIDQEIARLKFFQSSPPTGTVEEGTAALEKLDADRRKAEIDTSLPERTQRWIAKVIDDQKWGVRLVSIALNDGTSFLVTYGEMNTLADFYGSPQDMAQVPANNFRGIVGGVREESIRKFMRLRNELTDGQKKYDPDSDDHAIAGAIGNKATKEGTGLMTPFVNADQWGELKMMGEFGNEERLGITGKEETSYTAGLVRNACHFAPHSWHAWATAHQKAEALALESWSNRERSAKLEAQSKQLEQNRPGSENAVKYNREARVPLDAKAAETLNAALLQNGFGDHFLQDSYAAGHLINKSLIMQWFAQWLDTQGRKRDYSTEEQWRRVQQIAYGQPGVAGRGLFKADQIGKQASNDPQSVENLDGDWTDRFDALGLQIPGVLQNPQSDEFILFTWWQEQAMDANLVTTDYKVLVKKSPINDKTRVQTALKHLIDDGVVYYSHYSTKDRAKGADAIGLESFNVAKDLKLKKEYIPKKANKAAFLSAVQAARGGDSAEYDKMSKAVTYGDYHEFLNHGYLQLASNVLHDHFCAKGLAVATAQGDTPYKIYGDNAMLGKESAKMVKYSSETAHQSRDSIYELAMTGTTTKTTDSIAARLPTFVRPEGASANLSLEAWHGDGGALHTFCFKTIFPKVAAVFSKSTVAAKGELAGKASKDDTSAIHVGEAF